MKIKVKPVKWELTGASDIYDYIVWGTTYSVDVVDESTTYVGCRNHMGKIVFETEETLKKAESLGLVLRRL